MLRQADRQTYNDIWTSSGQQIDRYVMTYGQDELKRIFNSKTNQSFFLDDTFIIYI